jgi:LacI family transcriptional regulator
VSGHRITLSDIAQEAGVHVTTVSMALRDHPRLPESTRIRIQALAKRMGYVPDPILQSLVSYRGRNAEHRRSPTLAYVTNWATRWGWKTVTAHPEFFRGAERRAGELGYKLEHFWLGDEGMTQERLGRILFSRGICGVIVALHGRERGDVLEFDWSRFSAIKIDYFPHRPMLHNVTNHQLDIARLATHKVIDAGYRRIGFVMHRGWNHTVDQLWTAGFLCEQQLLPVKDRVPAHLFPEPKPVESWLNESTAEVTAPLESFQAWFERYQPEVIISKASFVLPTLKKMGLSIPRDVALVDMFLEAKGSRVAGVRQNHDTVGSLAVEILAGQLQQNKLGVPAIPTTTFVEGTWCDGDSCPRRR